MHNLSPLYFINTYIHHCKYSKGSAGVCSAGGPHLAHTDMHVCMHAPHFIFSCLLDPTMILLLRLSQVSRKRVWGLLWRTLCTHTSKWVWHTEPILITSKFLRKDIIRSLLSEIMKGWDTVSTPVKHGVWLHWGGQLCEWLLALTSQPSKKAN